MKANLPSREPVILARWEEIKLYERLMELRKGAPTFVLHDGPPYANGPVHMGTALNKILKDFIVRSRSMAGLRTPFVPGWDCNGMPIEHQVLRELGAAARSTPKLELRALCRAYAEKFIAVQRGEFRRLGVLGDWDHPYLTFAPAYSAAEIGVLRKLVEDGYVYRGLRPVHWCWSCRTALAEAEVEYREHVSPSIYVAFALNEKLSDAAALALDPADGARLAAAHAQGRLFAVIWTTTPWTIPANLGICLNEGFDYVALDAGENYYIVAARLAPTFERACSLAVKAAIPLCRPALRALDGQDIFRHPLVARDGRLMFNDHVTLDSGTGLVHTAPGHGYEDFVVGSRYGLKVLTPVDEAGIFTSEAPNYAGRQVFAANDAIVNDLRAAGALLHAEQVSHSYPHCWRCKQPVIFRATEQWFLRIDHQGLRERALAEIDKVAWIPRWSRERIRNMVERRPDWCLSRQRLWGVPIPALVCVSCGKVALELDVLRRCEEIFAGEGADAWYVRPLSDFVAPNFRCAQCGADKFDKGQDILDVWFDSGCSQEAVLARRSELRWPADLYVEAVDQHRGWFQVSLIPAVAVRAAAPYRAVLTHGLTLDELGRKMSKSLGNAENAAEVVERIGADVYRLVFASVDFTADMNVGETVFAAAAEAYRKIRNSCRYLLGNLFDFEPHAHALALAHQNEFDRYILGRLEALKTRVREAYDAYDFQAAYNALLNFVVVDLSSLYIDVVRDRLYCSRADSPERRSAQTSLYFILDALTRLLAPLIPYTADEIYSHMPGKRVVESVHLLEFAAPQPSWADSALAQRWDDLLAIRGVVLKTLEAMRQANMIGAPLEARLRLGVTQNMDGAGELRDMLKTKSDMLKELFIVSDVELMTPEEAAKIKAQTKMQDGETFNFNGAMVRINSQPPVIVVGERAPGRKCPRCWGYFVDETGRELCPRCRAVLGA
jgi:isoleucyl-tRNA synthetase